MILSLPLLDYHLHQTASQQTIIHVCQTLILVNTFLKQDSNDVYFRLLYTLDTKSCISFMAMTILSLASAEQTKQGVSLVKYTTIPATPIFSSH
jgi:hypothetical protein